MPPSTGKDFFGFSWIRPLLLIILGQGIHAYYLSWCMPTLAVLRCLCVRRENGGHWQAKQLLARGDLPLMVRVPRQILRLIGHLCSFLPYPRECERVRAPWANAVPHRVASKLTKERTSGKSDTLLGADIPGNKLAKANSVTGPSGWPLAWVSSRFSSNFFPSSDFSGLLVWTVDAVETP